MFKILIAEDDRKLCQLFERVLIKNGYYTKGVANGKEALDAMDKEYFDLLITDIMMPIMDGYELIDSIREAGNNMPVLMITAKNEFDDLKMGFMSGTDDFMVKPININEMVLRVAALLRRAQMINDRRQTIGGTLLECDSLTITTNGESIWLHVKKIRQEELRDVNMRKKTKSCVKRKVPTFKQ
ncbi:MAG: response regulator transcription factor [Clostridiales bacterium]|nr:response regulator transcription factor [Clostridiales bacterium]